MQRHPGQAVPQVQSTLAKLSLCRTPALGGRMLRCTSCDHRRVVYNSCGDRHCPTCRGARRAEWVESTRELLLPGVNYFQVVFTLPQELSALALGNRWAMYGLLFMAAWRALREAIEEECGFEPAALFVLHTWNQRLEHHPHLHALVPGGGPALRGKRWLTSRHPKHRRRRKPYLVDNRRLSARFRELYVAGLKRLHQQQKLKLDPAAFLGGSLADELVRLAGRDWVVYIEAPPTESASPEQVLKYLARYLTGGPISDARLIAHRNGKVSFSARSTRKPAAGEASARVGVTLRGVEFTRRWCLHVLPRQFTKVRRYGGFSNRRRRGYLNTCRDLLAARDEHPLQPPEADAGDDASPDKIACPRCTATMECVSDEPRPGWTAVMDGPHRPHWYRE